MFAFQTLVEIAHFETADIEQLPEATPKLSWKPIQLSEPEYIYFDLDTTDQSKYSFV